MNICNEVKMAIFFFCMLRAAVRPIVRVHYDDPMTTLLPHKFSFMNLR